MNFYGRHSPSGSSPEALCLPQLVDQPPEEFEPVVEALQEVGSSFEEFDRSRNFYELTVER